MDAVLKNIGDFEKGVATSNTVDTHSFDVVQYCMPTVLVLFPATIHLHLPISNHKHDKISSFKLVRRGGSLFEREHGTCVLNGVEKAVWARPTENQVDSLVIFLLDVFSFTQIDMRTSTSTYYRGRRLR